jgi:hypothetical protein
MKRFVGTPNKKNKVGSSRRSDKKYRLSFPNRKQFYEVNDAR